MKEKIGMGKLIELLNKAKPLKKYKEYWYIGNEICLITYAKDYGASESRNITLDVISKSFGFIKWLVENDKIDTSKANDKNLNGYEIELRIRAVKELVADSEEKTVLYLNLLMLLAIQDEPIRFLCEILK